MNFVEILFLLALDAENGVIKPSLDRYLDYALAGALLMDLAVQNRIDTDLTCIRLDSEKESRDPLLLRVVAKRPTGDRLLDEALKELQYKADPRPTRDWLAYFSGKDKDMRKRVVDSLAAKGVLKAEEKTRFLFFKTSRYSLLDAGELEKVKARLRELVSGEEIPGPREAALIGLANSCGLFEKMFSAEELTRARPRINALLKLDLIGQAMAKIISEMEHNITTKMRPC